ncbi:MAG: ABC transporter ATP-binding protein [Sulfolobales archaeon]
MNSLLEVNGLSVAYKIGKNLNEVVKDVTFSVDIGETLAIVGESGSGKSTVALSIVRALPENAIITKGSIFFEGKDLLKLDLKSLRYIRGKDISIIFQDPLAHLNPLRKVKLLFKDLFNDHGLEFDLQRVVELLNKLKIPDPQRVLDAYPYQLSGGMAQRVFIALALAMNPRLLIADEPTSALDLTIQSQVVKLLKEVKKSFKVSMIIITHDMGVAASIADRIVVMHNGKVVEEGPPEEILIQPKSDYTKNLVISARRLYEGGLKWIS